MMNFQVSSVERLGYVFLVSMPPVSLLSIFKITQIGGLSIRPIDILFLCLLCLWILQIIQLGKIHKNLATLFVSLTIFFFVTLLGGLFTYDDNFNAPKYIRFVQTMLWGMFALAFIDNEEKLNRLLANITAAGVILAVSSIYIFLTIPGLHRIGGFISFADGEGSDRQDSYNEVGALYALVVSIFLWRHYKNLLSKLDFLKISIVLFGMILAQSRSSFVAVALAILFLLSFDILNIRAAKVTKKSIRLIIAIMAATVGAIFFAEYLTINRLTDSFNNSSSANASTNIRFYLWGKGFSLLEQNVGTLFLGYGNALFTRKLGAASTDNFFLDSALSVGIIGTVVILAIILTPSLTVWKAGRYSRHACLGVLVTIVALTVSLTGNVVVDPMYGGITFLLLYALVSVQVSTKGAR